MLALTATGVVVVQWAGESSTVILNIASPRTGILVLFAVQSFRVDGDSCLSSQPMFLHTVSLMVQLNAPVSDVIDQLLALATKVSNFSTVVTFYACFGVLLCWFSLL